MGCGPHTIVVLGWRSEKVGNHLVGSQVSIETGRHLVIIDAGRMLNN